MRAEALALLDKARENLQASRTLIESGFFSIAASRCYYTMFYAAEALPLDKGLRFASHGAVHAAFGWELVLSGRVQADLHRYLLDAFRACQTADYEAPAEVSRSGGHPDPGRAGSHVPRRCGGASAWRRSTPRPRSIGWITATPGWEQNPDRVSLRPHRIFSWVGNP